nr:MAG TPA: hypothetical protein [Caudoviricetes sp.]
MESYRTYSLDGEDFQSHFHNLVLIFLSYYHS